MEHNQPSARFALVQDGRVQPWRKLLDGQVQPWGKLTDPIFYFLIPVS